MQPLSWGLLCSQHPSSAGWDPPLFCWGFQRGLTGICQALDVPCQRAQEETAVQTSDVLCVSVCSEGGFFHPLGCSYCLPPLCAGRTGPCEEQPPVRSTQGLGSCVAVPGVMQEACGEVRCLTLAVTYSAGPSSCLSAER